METEPDSLIQVLGMVALAVVTTFIGVKKLLKGWQSDSTETSIIKLMHTELERLSKQNTELSIELGRLHTEVIALNKQLQQLTIENQLLQNEVITLTREVSRLQTVLHKGGLDGNTS